MKSYSIDLRSRVIESIETGNSLRVASKIFKVSKSAISRWWNRYKEEGVISPKPNLGSKGKVSPDILKEFVELNSDKTLAEIGKHFGVSACSIYKRLKKLGYSYKKKLLSTKNPTPRKGQNI